jgi:hypothetical protein
MFARHLEEVNDLKEYRRDAPLEKSESNLQKLEIISEKIYQKIVDDHKRALLFITSPRVRAIETAELVAHNIQRRASAPIKVRFSSNEDLKSTEQGDFVLPEDYSPTDFFIGLDLASKIFTSEAHLSDTPGMEDNLSYRFGDPLLLPDGSYKYPELLPYFRESGESYGQTLVRIYNSVLEMSEKYHKLLGDTEVVIVSHGQIYHVLRGLSELGKMIRNGEVDFSPGDSPKWLWEIYKRCDEAQKVTGICMPLDLEMLKDEGLMLLLRKEASLLQAGS